MEKTEVKYLKLCVTVKAILLVFSNLCLVKSGLSQVNYLLSKQKST